MVTKVYYKKDYVIFNSVIFFFALILIDTKISS